MLKVTSIKHWWVFILSLSAINCYGPLAAGQLCQSVPPMADERWASDWPRVRQCGWRCYAVRGGDASHALFRNRLFIADYSALLVIIVPDGCYPMDVSCIFEKYTNIVSINPKLMLSPSRRKTLQWCDNGVAPTMV